MPDHTATTTHVVAPTEASVLAALRAHPGGTVAEIARAAGVGRSTAGKVLVTAEQRGHARRTPGSLERGGRTPDRWNPASDVAKSARLGRGALRDMVAEFLAAQPGTEFSPVTLGKALGRSSGAIANALTKLTATGQAIQTSERPARYAAAEADSAVAADDTSQ